jgi:cystathionine beta-lyase/cystathionine gamma-synthase
LKIADIVHKHNPKIKVVIDNTFAIPLSLFGGIISFELNFNFDKTKKFVNSFLKLIKLAISLDGVESLLEHLVSIIKFANPSVYCV